MAAKTLFLIDGSAIAYRSYFAFIHNPLINSKGQNTSAVFGFLRFLFMIYDTEKPDYLAVVFDPKSPTFRHKQYKEYKATRQKMPDDMREQMPLIHKVLDAVLAPRIEIDGFEADDVIGTLARQAQGKGLDTYIVSGDKDFMQLVDKDIKLYKPRRANEDVEILDEAGVLEKVGLPPEKIIDYLGLMGDTSDNVPGVKGIGQKTAVKLISEYGSLEAALDNAEKVSRANVRENLLNSRDIALLSKKLVTIDTNVAHDVTFESLQRIEPDYEALAPLFAELEFTSLLDRYRKAPPEIKSEFHLINSPEKLQKLANDIKKSKAMALSLMTTPEPPMQCAIAGMAISLQPGEAFYLPLTVEENDNSDSPHPKHLVIKMEGDLFGGVNLDRQISPLLEDASIRKIGHNIKFIKLVLLRYGVNLGGVDFDTMLASYIVNPSLRQHTLASLALEHLNISKGTLGELLGKGKKQMDLCDLKHDAAMRYAGEEAELSLNLVDLFRKELKNGGLEKLYNTVELPLVNVLADVEYEGVALDFDFLAAMSQRMQGKIDELVRQIYDIAGEEFNINSTQQLGEILFEKLNLPKKKRTKTGYSTDASVLEELAKMHELPSTLLEYRELTKLKSTYVDALPNLVSAETGRLHTSYNQTVAATGRLSSSDPNLQNIPIRTEMGREIRRAFIPRDENHLILDADYSQIELRIMAHLSQDPVLLESFRNGDDIHTKTACLIFNIEPEQLEHEHRRKAKEINFGVMYGMGSFGLAARLNISNDEARAFIDSYFALYQKVRDYIYNIHDQVEKQGYITTLLNRRRYLPEIHSKNRNLREFAKRTAVNTPIQGTAAELLKVAMLNIWRKLGEGGYKTRMIMQVHDELVFEVPKNELEEMKILVTHEMENALPLDVPIKAEFGVGVNWLDAK